MPQIPNVTLPKVTRYLLNVGKSVKFAAIDYLGEKTAPNIANFMETNEDLFKEVYSATVNYKDTFRKANKAFKDSRIYEAGEVGFKALMEDLKTGNFYNKEREDALDMKALDMDIGDMEFDESAFEFDLSDEGDTAKQTRSINTSIEAATTAASRATVETGNMIAGTMKQSTKMIWAQNEKLMASMTAGMGTIHSAISNVGNFLQGPLLTALQNTKTYQEEAVKHFNKTEAQLDELLEMQRNLYKPQTVQPPKDVYGSVIDYDGIPDLREYGKVVFKNFKTLLGPEADILLGDSFGKNSNMLLALVASPLKTIPELLVKTIVPITLKKSLETFDKSLGGLFPQFIQMMNNRKDDQGIMGYIARLLGINIEKKRNINTSKYNKGPVPFDGITRQAIIEVIPGHLRRIEAALTGQMERIYNMESGRWTNINEVKKSFDDRKEAAEKMPWYDARQAVDEYIRELREGNKEYNVKIGTKNRETVSNVDLAKQLERLIDHITKKTFEDGYFLGNKNYKDDVDGSYETAGSYYTKDLKNVTEATYEELMKRLGNKNVKNRSKLNVLAGEIVKSMQSYNQYLYNIENLGHGVENQLFNGAFKEANSSSATKGFNAFGKNNFLALATDEKGNNIFYYLQRIYAALLTGSGGKGKGKISVNKVDEALKLINSNLPDSNETRGPPETIEVRDVNGEIITIDASENWEMRQIIEARRAEKEKRSDENSILSAIKSKMTIGEKFSESRKVIADYLDKPAKLMDDLIHAADKRLYEVFYGREEMLDVEKEEGHKFNGIMDRFLFNMEETFDKIDDWLHENLFKSVKDFLHETGWDEKLQRGKEKVKELIHWQDIKDSFSRKFGIAKSSVTGAFQSVSNDIKNSAAGQQVGYRLAMMNAGHAEDFLRKIQSPTEAPDWVNSMSESDWKAYGELIQGYIDKGLTYNEAEAKVKSELGFAANGKYITKRGLVMVSPGEMIIPAGGKRVQQRQLAKEKAMARRIGFKGKMFATGTSNALLADEDSPNGIAQGTNLIQFPGGQTRADEEATQSTMRKVLSEMGTSTKVADVITSGLIGSGVSLITGMIGGPLLGGAVGAALSVIKNSETANKFVFGEEVTDISTGEVTHKGGLISGDFQKKFFKYFPDMKNYGIVGSIAGLFTPFGLVGGLMAGGAVGFLKNNEDFQTAIFGAKDENGERDGGLIKKEFRERLSKAAPRMLVGAAGTAILGPFGILGGAVLGSALGYTTTTDKFHEFIFGVEQKDGTTKGGIANALKEGFVNPMKDFAKDVYAEAKDFFKNKVIDPLKEFVNPATQMVKNLFTSIADKISDSVHEKVVTPISDFVQHRLLEPFGGVLMKLLRIPINAAKGLISAPISLLQGIGNNIRGTQIAKGTATDMTAAERIKWRDEHKKRSMFGKITGKDKFNGIDQMLVSEFEGKEGLEQLKGMRDALNIYVKNSKKIGASAAKLQQKLIVYISDFLNERTLVDENGKTVSIYTHVGYKAVNKINKIVANGELKGPELIYKELDSPKFRLMSIDDKAELMGIINAQWPGILAAIERTGNELKNNDNFLSAIGVITKQKLTDRKDMRTLMRNLDKEISTRESEAAWGTEELENSDAKLREEMANGRLKVLMKASQRQHDELIDVLNNIGTALGGNKFKPISTTHDDGTVNRDVTSSPDSREGRPDKDIEEGHFGGVSNEYQNPEAQARYEEVYEQMIEVGYSDSDARSLAAQAVTSEFGIDPRKYEHNPVQKIGGLFRRVRNKIGGGVNKARKGLFKGATGLLGGAGKIAGKTIGAAAALPKGIFRGLVGGFKDQAELTDESRDRKFKDSFGDSLDTAYGGVKSIGGMLQGPKDKIMKMFKTGYSMGVDANGQPTVIDNASREPVNNEDSRAWKEKRQEDEKYKKGLLSGVHDIAEGTFGLIGNFFGAGWRKIKQGAGWLSEKVSDVLDSTGIVGKIIKGVFGIGKLAITASMIGHVAKFFIDTFWEPIIKPFWENNLKPAIANLGTSIYNFLTDTLPEGAKEKIDQFITGAKQFFENPLAAAWDFFVEGLHNFWDYIAKPLGNVLLNVWDTISVPLGNLIWNAIHNNKLDDFLAKSSSVNKVSNQETDEYGNKIYIDKNGNKTTEAVDEEGNSNTASVVESNVQTKEYGKYNVINWISHGCKSLKYQRSTSHNGTKYILEEYYNGLVVVKNTSNGEFMRFKLGDTEIEFGARCDENYQCSATSIIGRGIEGALIGSAVATGGLIATAGLGATVGSVVPGIGTVIGCAVGLVAGLVVYTVKNNSGYTATAKFDINRDPECIAMMASLGWVGGTDNTENWGTFPDLDPENYYADTDSTPVPTTRGTDGGNVTVKKITTAVSDINAIASSNLSPTEKRDKQVELAQSDAYKDYTLYIDENAKIMYNPATMTLTNGAYLANGTKYTGAVLDGGNVAFAKDLMGSTDTSGSTTRNVLAKELSDDELVGKYFKIASTGKYYEISKNSSGTLIFNTGNGASLFSKGDQEIYTKNGNNYEPLTVASSGSSRRKKSGKGHLYQHAVELSNKKFGNSTIGEAGCGPVAATNLINKMGGNMDVDTAASYAENGGFIDSSTGGTTTDYLHSILNNSGIPTEETSNKSYVLDSLKSGNPVMMLGNSGAERGTPFGANDHYITAMGLDNSGNAIVEDPDLPGGYKKYPAVDVLRDMDVGITTGMRRRRAASSRRRKSGRGPVAVSTQDLISGATIGVNTVKNADAMDKTKHAIPAWTVRCADLIALCESVSAGGYQAVNANDVGSMSVGKYQFRKSRAIDLLKRIISAIVNRGSMTHEQIRAKIGTGLYNYVYSSASNSKYVPSKAEVDGLKELLGTDDSIIQQDLKMVEDCIDLYLKPMQKSWPSLTIKKNEDVIIFLANMKHNAGNLIYFTDNNGSLSKSPSDWTLDDVYKIYAASNSFKRRAEKSYNYLRSTLPVGDGTTYLTGEDLASKMVDQTNTATDQISSGSGTHDTGEEQNQGVLGLLGSAIRSVMTDLYGERLMALFGSNTSTNNNSADGSFSSDGIYSGTLNSTANNAQQALVDRMNSVHGKLRYSLDGGEQNPDNGVGSCASTVGWAYRKTLGIGNMSAGSSTQSKDSRFTTIWEKTGNTGSPPQDIMQPGDILYINWDRKNKPFNANMQYPMAHTEMYDGSGGTINHGGGANSNTYGTTNHQLSTRNNYIMKVRRYTPFINGEKPDFWNLDGSKGIYAPEKTASNPFGMPTIPGMNNSLKNLGFKTQYNFITGQNELVKDDSTAGTTGATPGITPGINAAASSASNYLVGATAGLTNSYAVGLQNIGSGRGRLKSTLSKTFNPEKVNQNSIKLFNEIEKMDEPEKDIPPSGTSRSAYRGKSRKSGRGYDAVSYDDFLEVIVNLLQVIAKNSDNLTTIVNILRDNYRVNINTSDITAGKSRKDHLKKALRNSGLGRSIPSRGKGGYAPAGHDEFGGNVDSSTADIKYIVDILRDMAKA